MWRAFSSVPVRHLQDLVQRDVDAGQQGGVDGARFTACGACAVIHAGVAVRGIDQPHLGGAVGKVFGDFGVEFGGPIKLRDDFEGD
jgi:hypothetical protein